MNIALFSHLHGTNTALSDLCNFLSGGSDRWRLQALGCASCPKKNPLQLLQGAFVYLSEAVSEAVNHAHFQSVWGIFAEKQSAAVAVWRFSIES